MSDRRNECSITNYASIASISLLSFSLLQRCDATRAREKALFFFASAISLLLFAKEDRGCFLFRVKGSGYNQRSEAWLDIIIIARAIRGVISLVKNGLSPLIVFSSDLPNGFAARGFSERIGDIAIGED